MTVKKFLEEYAKNGSSMMEEVTKKCSKVCLGWIFKALKKANRIEKHDSSNEIKDMVQSIYIDAICILFEKALQKDLNPEKTALTTYLIAVCKGLAYKKEASFIELPPFYEHTASTDYEAENYSPQQLALLRSCMNKLEEKQRELVMMAIEKVPHEEIAEELGYRNRDVVKSTYYKALNALRECLKHFFN